MVTEILWPLTNLEHSTTKKRELKNFLTYLLTFQFQLDQNEYSERVQEQLIISAENHENQF